MQVSRRNAFIERHFWLLCISIMLLAALMRLTNLFAQPIFIDEATHILRAFNVLDGEAFVGLSVSKGLHPYYVALFQPGGSESLWIARAASGIISIITTAVCIDLGRAFSGRAAGLTAGMLYAVLPYAVFHERQALVDGLHTALLSLIILFSVWQARRPSIATSFVLGLVISLSLISRIAALPYVLLPVAGAVLLAKPFRQKVIGVVLGSISGAMGYGGLQLYYELARRAGQAVSSQYRASSDNLLLSQLAPTELLGRILADLYTIIQIFVQYAGITLVVLMFACVLWTVVNRKLRLALLFLGIPGVVFLGVPLLAAGPAGLPPRYMLSTVAPLTVMAAISGLAVFETIHYQNRRTAGISLLLISVVAAIWSIVEIPGYILMGLVPLVALIMVAADSLAMISINRPVYAGLVAAFVLLPMLIMNGMIISVSDRVPLPEGDLGPYSVGQPDRYNDAAVADVLLDHHRDNPDQRMTIMVVGGEISAAGARVQYLHRPSTYFGPRIAEVILYDVARDSQPRGLARALAQGEAVFVVDATSGTKPFPPVPHGLQLESMPTDSRFEQISYRLYRVNGASGALAGQVFDFSTPDPERLNDQYMELAEIISTQSTTVFPAAHADKLQVTLGGDVNGLQLTQWPADRSEAQNTVTRLPNDGVLHVVLVDEAQSDPERTIATALDAEYYWLDERWAGLLHSVRYSGGGNLQFSGINATYEHVIHLRSGAFTPNANQKKIINFELEWETDTAIADPYLIFVHVINQNGELIAQHDGEPGGGLYPLMSWQPGEPVSHRFAIQIPEGTAPGTYQVITGIYLPDSGLRLRVTDGPTFSTDAVLLGEIEIE